LELSHVGRDDCKMDTTGNNGGKKVAMHSLVVLFALILAFARLAEAQQPTKIPRIGFLTGSGDPLPYGGPLTKGFRQGLQDLGYVEGKPSRSSIAPPREK
jgi:hypothetical protein